MSSKDLVNRFYFSGGSNFGAFKTATDKRASTAPSPKKQRAAHDSVSTAKVDLTLPVSDISASSNVSGAAAERTADRSADTSASQLGGTGIHAIRGIASKDKLSTSSKSHNPPPPDAASQEYFQFLRQQQEMQRNHNRLEESIVALENGRRDRQNDIRKLRAQCHELLQTIEQSSDWKLKSKYDVQQLIRDCNLALQPVELVPVQPAQTLAVKHLASHFQRLHTNYGDRIQYAPYKLNTDQCLRRLHVLEETLKEGNMDASHLVHIADTLIVQLENIMKLSTLEDMIKQREALIERETFAVEDMKRKRDEAVSDGEVHVAEELCYKVILSLEHTLNEVVAKAETLEKAVEENVVVANVSTQYHQKTPEELNRIVTKCTKLRGRCLEDIQKMFSLRDKVEEVESQTAAKVLKDREESDKFLVQNQKRIEEIFTAMEALEREAEVLERDRHREYVRRLTEKDKDEHRRAEFARFCCVVEEHLQPLERTVKNMDLMLAATEAVRSLIDNSFASIADDLSKRQRLLAEVKIESHKEHVEVFRSLLMELGEIIYRKERMIEETDKKIQQAHVQQELLAETFNPNAKRFGDIKKSLLKNRDELEADVHELKERAAASIAQFGYSESALTEANVSFVHPVTEQEHHTLALRAKMMEFKAMLLGHSDNHPVVAEIEDLKRSVQDAAESISVANTETTGVISKALPMIRAANRARFQQAQ